jgi:hypothetical protein
VYDPAVRPLVLIPTEMELGVVPLAGVAVNHPADVVTVKVNALPLLDVVTVCAAGVVPPIWYAKLKVVGLSVRFGVEDVTFNVTATVRGLFEAPLAVTVTVPL